MALNTPGLKEGIITLLSEMRTRAEISDEEYADRLATLIEQFVKTGAIVYNAGLVAPSGGGAVTGAFEGEIT